MSDAVVLTGVGKRYGDRWAVRDLDLRVGAGEAVGVLGANGAGKTTTLRLLAGVTAPSAGRVRVVGRIAPLIGIGVGFHPELSGRENVAVNGALLGLDRARLAARYDDIVGFSGLDDVLSTPVKFYSSGMLLRLAFAVAVHTDPDVLLVDELLAVGDTTFQARCLARMAELRAAGTTLVLVTHSAHTVAATCERAVVLGGGEMRFEGPVGDAVAAHAALLGSRTGEGGAAATLGRAAIMPSGTAGTAGPVTSLDPGRRYRFRQPVRFHAAVASPQVRLTVLTERGEIAYQAFSADGLAYRRFGADDEVEVEVGFTAALGAGRYHFAVELRDATGTVVLAHDADGVLAEVDGDPGEGIAPLGATVTVTATR